MLFWILLSFIASVFGSYYCTQTVAPDGSMTLEMSNNAMNQYNAQIDNNYNNNSARQRCLSNCLINNSSGSGFGGALSGLAACNQQCP